MSEFEIGMGGRVKMAGGAVDVYYEAAEPLIEEGISGALETHRNFIALRENPPAALKAAFFPSVGQALKQRTRGAGLYRFLRMDQGPGGNFTPFEFADFGDQQSYEIRNKVPHAILEKSVEMQMTATSKLGVLATKIINAYADDNLAKTFGLLKKFSEQAENEAVTLPSSGVGSRSGFFMIQPVETNAKLTTDIMPTVMQALDRARSYADVARVAIKQGVPYAEAIHRGYQNPQLDAEHDDLLYFQPDALVATDGSSTVEKINMPDVGLFLSVIDTAQNEPLRAVADVVDALKDQLASTIQTHVNGGSITIVTKDETLTDSVDVLELYEIDACKTMLERLGFDVEVTGISSYRPVQKPTTILLLNPDTTTKVYASFTEHVLRSGQRCYPDPILKAFEHEATALHSIRVAARQLDTFMDLIKPGKIDDKNAPLLQERLCKILKVGGVSEDADILYAYVPGNKTPVPMFRYSLHSFAQLHTAVERSRRTGHNIEAIQIRPIPFKRETAVFRDNSGVRLAAFRPMFMKGTQ